MNGYEWTRRVSADEAGRHVVDPWVIAVHPETGKLFNCIVVWAGPDTTGDDFVERLITSGPPLT